MQGQGIVRQGPTQYIVAGNQLQQQSQQPIPMPHNNYNYNLPPQLLASLPANYQPQPLR